MRPALRICLLVLAILMTIFGWNVSKAGVCLVWLLFALEELIRLQLRERTRKAPYYLACKITLFAVILLLLAGAVYFAFFA